MIVQSILQSKGDAVATVRGEVSLADAAALLRDHGIGALVVSADGRTIDGILSERDIVRAIAAHGAQALGRTVSSTMSRQVTTCARADGLDALMSQMTDRRIRHLPVVDDDGVLSGIVSIGDVVKGRLADLQDENQALTDYIHQGH